MNLKPIYIGNIEIKNPVILAPMSGVTDLPFRLIVKQHGVDLVISEMIASQAMIRACKQTMRMSSNCSEEFPMAVQLAGCEPEVMAEAAKLNRDRGAAIIDINFGCPMKKVAINSHAGSALMRDELKAAKILEATVKAVPDLPVTLKMRTGWNQENRNAQNLAKIAEECGIKMITVHGRTRCDFYNNVSDWEFIKRVKEVVKLPVIANGDIICFDSAKRCLEVSGADGIMIGRGMYGKPYFINHIVHFLNTGERLEKPDVKIQYEVIVKHYHAMLEHYGESTAVKIARKHLGWYIKGFPGSAEFRAKINMQTDSKKSLKLIDEFYKQFC